MQLSRDHSWTKREKSEAGDSLTKVIEQGLLRPAVATDVVGVVLEEVAMEVKKLVIIKQMLCVYLFHYSLSLPLSLSLSFSLSLSLHSSKMLLAVDEFNGLFNPTSIKLGKHEWVSLYVQKP